MGHFALNPLGVPLEYQSAAGVPLGVPLEYRAPLEYRWEYLAWGQGDAPLSGFQ